jgi:hypothetical protein
VEQAEKRRRKENKKSKVWRMAYIFRGKIAKSAMWQESQKKRQQPKPLPKNNFY